ncbi:hypothetical protein phiST2_0101 [Vibrio phage phi-ST2]|nr:hypothetical protein phiST2_0101 [Vibrio phage phi-ST2]
MLKLTVFDIEQVVQVGMPIRVQNIRTEEVFTTHVGLIRGHYVAVYDDDSIYTFTDGTRLDDSELFRLADNATLTHI